MGQTISTKFSYNIPTTKNFKLSYCVQKTIKQQVEKLDLLIGDVIVGYNEDEPIEVVLGRLLTKNNLTISTAESCTGGKIAATLTAVSGASNYFKGSVVSYATETKINVLITIYI
jgi:nicotinamide-nucleotide amidase